MCKEVSYAVWKYLLLFASAAAAQLIERQTEDLKVPGSTPGLGILQERECVTVCRPHRPEDCLGLPNAVFWRLHWLAYGPLLVQYAWAGVTAVGLAKCKTKSMQREMTAVGFEPTPLRTGA